MDQHSKSELIRSYRKRYRKATKREKTQIISQIVDATGYCRKHVIRALNRDLEVPKRIRRRKSSRYAHLYNTLRKVWAAGNFVCGKRLQPFLPELVRSLSCYIEQKNWDVVRKMIGYARLDTHEQLDTLRRIHNLMALYQNYFQPSRKLLKKQRIGARVRKTYDTAQTPAQRLLSRKDTPAPTKKLLRSTFRDLNPAQLLRTINDLISALYHPELE